MTLRSEVKARVFTQFKQKDLASARLSSHEFTDMNIFIGGVDGQ